jgi:hypothetical protein
MSVLQCLGCNGVYPTVETDGARCFHVCPPGTPPANVRNDNVPSTAATDAGNIISAGKGVQPAAAVPPGMAGLAALPTPKI